MLVLVQYIILILTLNFVFFEAISLSPFAALCPPTNLAGTTSCETNVLSLTWDPSPVSGATYFLFAQEVNGTSAIYSASGTSMSIPGLSCGQLYAFSVSASHSHCNSSLSAPEHMYTGEWNNFIQESQLTESFFIASKVTIS